MFPGKQIKYGWIRGGEQGQGATVAVSQTFKNGSAKFVKRTGATTSTVTACITADTDIYGWLEIEEHTTDSTAGTEVRKVITDRTAIFRIPINQGTYQKYMAGKACDFVRVTATAMQTAAIDSALYCQLIIEGGDSDSSLWVDVRLNPLVSKGTAGTVGVV